MSELFHIFPVLILLVTLCLSQSIIEELGFWFFILWVLTPNLALATAGILSWMEII